MKTPKTTKLILLLTLAIVAFISLPTTLAQKATSPTNTRPFEPLEELHFEAEFSRALLRRLDVADLKFSATRTPVEDSSATSNQSDQYALTFKAEVTSKGFFARLFNLRFREVVESIVEPMSFTVKKTTIHDEQGKRVRTTESTFDSSKGKMTWTLRDPNNPASEPRHAITEFSGQLQDVLSAIYFIRTQPLEVGKTFEVFIGDGGRVYKTPIKVTEKKRMKTVLGRVDVLRVSAELFGPERLIDRETGEFSIWVTDDKRHIPVGGRVKTDYGTFDIKLKRVVTSPPAVK
ncbi:MAG TPA: DUF3108 domain-containing protein [Pyrinomonadaceae bacterium]|nr:DUF3108 domain-containing protein [Pyrinomonadaceae bacterium]